MPDFAWALGDTGLKINLSLIAKDVDENGKLVLDEVEGMKEADARALRERYSDNVGTIIVIFNDAQLKAAMADPFIDYIIPFHRSQWKKSQYQKMGLPTGKNKSNRNEGTWDYTNQQNEKLIKKTYHEYRGKMVADKATNFMPNQYWDFDRSGKENAEKYLELCAAANKRPKFYKFLVDNHDGSYSLQPDGSTDGYWKLLIDFKMYNNDGIGSPQLPVKPNFNMQEATRMLDEYKGGHEAFPVAQDIVDEFTAEYEKNHPGAKDGKKYSKKLGTWGNINVNSKNELAYFGVDTTISPGAVVRKIMSKLTADGFFNSDGIRLEQNADTGIIVEFNHSGFDETFGKPENYKSTSNSLKELKLATVRFLPEAVKYGEVIEYNGIPLVNVRNYHKRMNQQKNPPNLPTFAYIHHPVTVDGIPHDLVIQIRRSQVKDKFWVHQFDVNPKTIAGRAATTGSGVDKKSTGITGQQYNSANEVNYIGNNGGSQEKK